MVVAWEAVCVQCQDSAWGITTHGVDTCDRKEKNVWILINFTFFQDQVELMWHSLDAHSDPQESYMWYSGESSRKQYQPTRAASTMPSCAIMGQLSDRVQFYRNFPYFKWGSPQIPAVTSYFIFLDVYLHLFGRWIIDLAQKCLFWLNFLECLKSIKLGALDFLGERQHFLSFVVQQDLGQGKFLCVTTWLEVTLVLTILATWEEKNWHYDHRTPLKGVNKIQFPA